jgi:hypothetical protein
MPTGRQPTNAANDRRAGCDDLEKAMKQPTYNARNNDERNRRPAHLDPELPTRSISYHPGVSDSFDAWAEACRFHPDTLRRTTEFAIRNRHHQAIPEDARYKHRVDCPDIFRLSLGTADVYYSIEQQGVLVRGYGWEIAHEPLDDRDGGGYYVN